MIYAGNEDGDIAGKIHNSAAYVLAGYENIFCNDRYLNNYMNHQRKLLLFKIYLHLSSN